MANYTKYAVAIDGIAKEMTEAFSKAQTRFDRAAGARRVTPMKGGDPEYVARAAAAEAEYRSALAELNRLQTTAPGTVRQKISALRSELAEDLRREFGANPADVDLKTVQLLQAGILTADEYAQLADDATPTMRRVIGGYAMNAAEAEEKRGNIEKARTLRAISYAAGVPQGEDVLMSFDALGEVLTRSVNNPAMLTSWDQLAQPFMEAM